MSGLVELGKILEGPITRDVRTHREAAIRAYTAGVQRSVIEYRFHPFARWSCPKGHACPWRGRLR